MDKENQYLRWGIPGWIFILVIISYWASMPDFDVNVIYDSGIVGVLVLIAGIGIPLGFLLYQLYFALIWWTFNNDISKKTISGLDDEISLDTYKIDAFFIKKHRREWPHVENYWYKRIYELGYDNAGFLLNRHYGMLSTFHSLGSSIFSIIFASIISFSLYLFVLDYSFVEVKYRIIMMSFFWASCCICIFLNRRYIRFNIISYQNSVLKNIHPDKQDNS